MVRAFLFFLLPLAAAASEVECNYAGSQRQMNECAARDYRAADKELNDAYAGALLRSTETNQLRQEQRNWIRRRDARCNPKKAGDGTNNVIDFYTCMQVLTEIRTLQLKKM